MRGSRNDDGGGVPGLKGGPPLTNQTDTPPSLPSESPSLTPLAALPFSQYASIHAETVVVGASAAKPAEGRQAEVVEAAYQAAQAAVRHSSLLPFAFVSTCWRRGSLLSAPS